MSPLTKEDCYQYLKEKVFLLRPAEYSQKHPLWPGSIGIEVEMLPFIHSSSERPQLMNFNSQPSINQVLSEYAKQTNSEIVWADDSQTKILKVLTPAQDNLTFEPGGQLEISTSPYACLDEAVERFHAMKDSLKSIFQNLGADLACVGINPWYTVDEVGLQMDKPRYQAMNDYFNRISTYGQRMMRQTCTIQVNLDFGPDESTLIKRYAASQMLSPLASAIFANSPVVDRKESEYKTFRSKVWMHTDPSRTGLIDMQKPLKSLSLETLVQSYLRSVFEATVIFIDRLDFKSLPQELTFEKWLQEPFEGVSPTLEDFETHLSLHFPDVRPKGFLELRSIDAQLDCWQNAPASFCVGLLYEPQALDQLLDLMEGQDYTYLTKACLNGLDDPKILELSQKLMRISLEGISRLPSCYRNFSFKTTLEKFAEQFTFAGKTPADDIVSVFRNKGGLSYADILMLNEKYNLSSQ